MTSSIFRYVKTITNIAKIKEAIHAAIKKVEDADSFDEKSAILTLCILIRTIANISSTIIISEAKPISQHKNVFILYK